MAISLTICNLALGDIRAPQISDPGEATIEAQYCQRYYPHCLALLLDDYDWSFTKRVASLALLEANERAVEWAYAYALPSDCGMALRLLTGNLAYNYDWLWQSIPLPVSQFIVEAGILYTNEAGAVLEYASNAADESNFPPLFREALRKLLAANLAVPIRDDSNLEIKLLKEAQAARDAAMASDMNRAPVRQNVDDVAWARR